MMNMKINRVSLGYKTLPVTMVLALLGWIINCMTGNAAFPNPPVPLVPPVPPDPTQPLDMTTRMNTCRRRSTTPWMAACIQTAAKNAALESAFEGMDANAFYVQTMARTNLPVLLASGYQAVSTNRGQSPLDTPAITGIDNDMPTQLDVHLTTVANALGYEVQTSLGCGHLDDGDILATGAHHHADEPADRQSGASAGARAGRQHGPKSLVHARLQHGGLTPCGGPPAAGHRAKAESPSRTGPEIGKLKFRVRRLAKIKAGTNINRSGFFYLRNSARGA